MDTETGNDLTLSPSIKDHLGNSRGKYKGRKNQRVKKPKPVAKHRPSKLEQFSPEQKSRLEEVFQVDKYPNQRMKSDLSKELGMTFAQVKHWFQNHRYQWRSKKKGEERTRLRNEINRIKKENSQLRAVARSLKYTCGLPKPLYPDDHRLGMENAIAEEERARMRGFQGSKDFVRGRPSVLTTLNLFGCSDNIYRQDGDTSKEIPGPELPTDSGLLTLTLSTGIK